MFYIEHMFIYTYSIGHICSIGHIGHIGHIGTYSIVTYIVHI